MLSYKETVTDKMGQGSSQNGDRGTSEGEL